MSEINFEFNNFEFYNINNTEFFTLNGIKTYARLVDVYDGDTITCIIPIFNKYYKFHIRLNDLDTCEIKSKNEELKKRALLARHKILNIVCKNNILDIHCSRKEIQHYLSKNTYLVYLECLTFDKYGRLLANVYETHTSEQTFSQLLIKERLGYLYHGKRKLNENEEIIDLTQHDIKIDDENNDNNNNNELINC
jgi:endonuclease YncB( thermonuclease family)